MRAFHFVAPVCSVCVMLNTSSSVRAEPVSTAFTYQGQLKLDDLPVTEVCDMEFAVFDAVLTPPGNEVVTPILFDDSNVVEVVNGLFNVELDWGAGLFNGQARWLQISVRCPAWDGQGKEPGFTTLSPRHSMTAAPYALYAINGPTEDNGWTLNGADIHNTNAGEVGIGKTSPVATLDVVRQVNDNYVAQFSGGFGVRIASGSTTGAALDLRGPGTGSSFVLGAVNFKDAFGVNHGGVLYRRSLIGDRLVLSAGQAERVYIDQNGRMGIGTAFPATRLHVDSGTGASLSGGGVLTAGSIAGLNIVIDIDDIMARNNGNAANLKLNRHGGNVGIGVFNPQGTLHVFSTQDVEPEGGGIIVAGSITGGNVAIDGNEIMARSNGRTSTLYLNNDGGTVRVGADLTVVGKIDIGYQVLHKSGTDSPLTISCPSGKKALGGGCYAGVGERLVQCSPTNSNTAWRAVFTEGNTGEVWVICARVK